jgi:hypothetical protein
MGQEDESMQIKNDRTDCRDKTAKIGLPVYDRQYRTARTGL